jgi:hypothetical protein
MAVNREDADVARLARLLQAERPAPSRTFVHDLERSLLEGLRARPLPSASSNERAVGLDALHCVQPARA